MHYDTHTSFEMHAHIHVQQQQYVYAHHNVQCVYSSAHTYHIYGVLFAGFGSDFLHSNFRNGLQVN